MEQSLHLLNNDRLTRLVVGHLPNYAVSVPMARQLSLTIRRCRCLRDLSVSFSHLSLDGLRILLQGAAACTSLTKLTVSGGFSTIQAKVLASSLRFFSCGAALEPAHVATGNSSGTPHGLTLTLEPMAQFSEVAATVLYDSLEAPTRIVELVVRSTVSNPHILTVLPRFRRRVQALLRRNRKLLPSTVPAIAHVEDRSPVPVAAAPPTARRCADDAPMQFLPPSPPPVRVPIPWADFPATALVNDTQHKSDSMGHRDGNIGGSVCNKDDAAKGNLFPSPVEWRQSDSNTPSPTLPRPPEPARFREDIFMPLQAENPVLRAWDIIHPVAPCEPPPQLAQASHRAPSTSASSSAFQRHVILELAAVKGAVQHQVQTVDDLRALFQGLTEETALQWSVIRNFMDAVENLSRHVTPAPPNAVASCSRPPARAAFAVDALAAVRGGASRRPTPPIEPRVRGFALPTGRRAS